MHARPLISIDDLAPFLANVPQRVLVRTQMHSRPDGWSDDFAAFAPDAIEHLAELGVVLVGLDTPSIEPASRQTPDSHQIIRRLDIRVLEHPDRDTRLEGDAELISHNLP